MDISPSGMSPSKNEARNLYVTVRREGDLIHVSAGPTKSIIQFTKNNYILTKNSTIPSYADISVSGISAFKERQKETGNLIVHNKNQGELLVQNKIRCFTLAEVFQLITGTDYSLPFSSIESVPSKSTQYLIPQKVPSQKDADTEPEAKPQRERKTRRVKKKTEIELKYRLHQKMKFAWIIDCGNIHAVVSVIRKPVKGNLDKMAFHFAVEPSSTIQKDSDFLSEELQEFKRSLEEFGALETDKYHSSLFKVRKKLTVPSLDSTLQLITGQNISLTPDMPFPFQLEEVTHHFNLLSEEEAEDEMSLSSELSYAFIKESDEELMVASKNAVAYIKQVRGTFVLLAGSTVISDAESPSAYSRKQKKLWLEAGTLTEHDSDKTIQKVETKIRFTSLNEVLGVIIGSQISLPYSSIGEMPETYSFPE